MAFSLFCALHNTALYSSTSVECVILVMLLIVVGFCRGLRVSSEFDTCSAVFLRCAHFVRNCYAVDVKILGIGLLHGI